MTASAFNQTKYKGSVEHTYNGRHKRHFLPQNLTVQLRNFLCSVQLSGV